MKLCTLVCAGLATAMCVTSVSATQIATEGFDYSTGSLDNQNEGTGWAAAWANATATASAGRMRCAGTNQRRDMNTVSRGYTAVGRELWVRYKAALNTTAGEMRFSAFGDDTVLGAQSTQVRFLGDGGIAIVADGGKTLQSTNKITKATQEFSVLIKYDFNGAGTDVISVWIDEDRDAFDGTQAPTLSYTGTIDTAGDFMSFRSTADSIAFTDDIVTGTDYMSIIHPQPDTLGLLIACDSAKFVIRPFRPPQYLWHIL